MAAASIPRLATFGGVIAAAAAATLCLHAQPVRQVDEAAERLLAGARAAIGERPAAPIRSLRLTGNRHSTQGVTWDMRAGEVRSVSSDESIEFRFLLPDRFAQVHLLGTPSQRQFGFIGTDPQAPGARFPVDRNVFLSQRQTANWLLLGVMARAIFPGEPLRVSKAGPDAVRFEGDAPGPFHFAGTLDLDPVTRVPLRFRRLARVAPHPPDTVLRHFDPANPPTNLGPSQTSEAVPETEVTMTFEDRRKVDGYLLPFRITTHAQGIVMQVLTFDRIEVNPSFGDEAFK